MKKHLHNLLPKEIDMAVIARYFIRSLFFVVVISQDSLGVEMVMDQTREVEKLPDVVQFGVSGESKFVFCRGEACPQRSVKHLYITQPQPSPNVIRVVPTPQVMETLIPEAPPLSHAKVKINKSVKHKKKKRKRARRHDCMTKP